MAIYVFRDDVRDYICSSISSLLIDEWLINPHAGDSQPLICACFAQEQYHPLNIFFFVNSYVLQRLKNPVLLELRCL